MSSAKVYIIYYSMYGHVETMAREIQKGANSVEGVEATLWQVPETLPERILEKMKAGPKADDVPEIRAEQLLEADGFIFGTPSRFGMMAAQVDAFFDSTHEIWSAQALAGKPAGIFWSTGFHGGGQELTACVVVVIEKAQSSCGRSRVAGLNLCIDYPLCRNNNNNNNQCTRDLLHWCLCVCVCVRRFTAIAQLAHHGMIFVPIGYTFGSGMFEMNEVKGGSSYGAGTYAADGSRQPTDLELQQAFYQGKYIATFTKKLKNSTPPPISS